MEQTFVSSLIRLIGGMAVGLLVANLLEALHWTRFLARLFTPLLTLAHFGESAGASFALAFISPSMSNGLLSEQYTAGRLSKRELVLANLLNSLPAWFAHMPSIFFMSYPILGQPALIYVLLTLVAATGRTFVILFFAHFFLSATREVDHASHFQQTQEPRTKSLWQIWQQAWQRFLRRLPKLLLFSLPVYCLLYALQQGGYFDLLRSWLATYSEHIMQLNPQALGIVVIHLVAEFGATIGATGSLLDSGGITPYEAVLALMLGNILSTPIRALRHQLPGYMGFYQPGLALSLVCANQGLRAVSMVLVLLTYYLFLPM